MVQVIEIAASGINATKAIQGALDRAAEAPIHVKLLSGDHISGGLRISSNTTLELTEGATLRFIPDYDAYAETSVAIEAEQSNRAMLTAKGARNISIIGAGRFLCDGSTAYSKGDDEIMGTRIPFELRPRVLVLDGCRDITLQDITVEDSPMWTLHFVDCDGLRITNVSVDNDRRMPNTDGIVIDSCRDVEITGCTIRTADDGIVLKTSTRLDGEQANPCAGVRVSDCTIESRSCALKVGTESFADFHDLTFTHCTIEDSNRALGIFSRDGGAVYDVEFSDIDLMCSETPDGFWGSGEPFTITALDRRPPVPAGSVSRIQVKNIRGSAPGAVNLWAERLGMISDVQFSNIALTQTVGMLGTSDAYDLRPTPADLEPANDAGGRINAWRLGADGRVIGLNDYPSGKPGLFAHNVTGLEIESLDLHQEDRAGLSPELIVTTKDA